MRTVALGLACVAGAAAFAPTTVPLRGVSAPSRTTLLHTTLLRAVRRAPGRRER